MDNHPDPGMPEYRYSLDRSDRIRSVSPEWVAFAIENGAPGLTESGVLGHRLWDFPPEAWVEVEAAIERLDLLDRLPVPWVSQGICPACHRSLEESISA